VEAYRTEPEKINPMLVLQLIPDRRVTKKHLRDWVLRGLSDIQPRTVGILARLRRVWHRNTNFDHGGHSRERGAHEAKLRADVGRLTKTRHYVACQRLPYRQRAAYLTLISAVHQLQAAGDWWKEWDYVDPHTRQRKKTLYLPEDTWSAATALHWCVAKLDRLLAAVGWATDNSTPQYTAARSTTGPERRRDGPEEMEWHRRAMRRWVDPPGAQPELPATT